LSGGWSGGGKTGKRPIRKKLDEWAREETSWGEGGRKRPPSARGVPHNNGSPDVGLLGVKGAGNPREKRTGIGSGGGSRGGEEKSHVGWNGRGKDNASWGGDLVGGFCLV